MTRKPGEEGFDPYAPIVGQDGLEYEDFAAVILGQPVDCWRNRHIQELRRRRVAEDEIRAWVKSYDGDDPTPSWRTDPVDYDERVARRVDASNARAAVVQRKRAALF